MYYIGFIHYKISKQKNLIEEETRENYTETALRRFEFIQMIESFTRTKADNEQWIWSYDYRQAGPLL